jgi:surface antigen
MTFRRLFAAAAVVLTLGACEGAQQRPGETFGAIIGAGLGALAGSQVGGGKGKLVAVAVGTLAGAYLGGELGRSLDESEREAVADLTQDTLEHTPTGTAATWENPDKTVAAEVVPTRTTVAATGETCRDFEQTVMVDGRSETVHGTACREGDGRWRIVE